jgi:hypothetical protein
VILKKGNKVILRVCASCEWIYSGQIDCPKCGFGSYSAYYVYGNKCYQYKLSQKPWLEKKLFIYQQKLLKEINESK